MNEISINVKVSGRTPNNGVCMEYLKNGRTLAAFLIISFFGSATVFSGTDDKKPGNAQEPYLLEFTASWCGFCRDMKPLVEKLEKEEKVLVKRYDTDTAEGDAKFREWNKKAKRPCLGIPYFVNARTLDSICGATDYESLKKWALEKPNK